MKRTALSRTARELGAITAIFAKVRVLHYVSEIPATAAAITERLGQRGSPNNAAQLLASFVRQGWVSTKANPANSSRQYSLTPKGRRLLASGIKQLRQLATTQCADKVTAKAELRPSTKESKSRARSLPERTMTTTRTNILSPHQ